MMIRIKGKSTIDPTDGLPKRISSDKAEYKSELVI